MRPNNPKNAIQTNPLPPTKQPPINPEQDRVAALQVCVEREMGEAGQAKAALAGCHSKSHSSGEPKQPSLISKDGNVEKSCSRQGHLAWNLYPFPSKHSDYNLACMLSFHHMERLRMKSALSRTRILLMAVGLSCCAKKPTTTIPANAPTGDATQTETHALDSPRTDSLPGLRQQLPSTKHPRPHAAGDSTRPQNSQLRTYHNYPDPSLDSAKAAKKRKEAARKPNGQRP